MCPLEEIVASTQLWSVVIIVNKFRKYNYGRSTLLTELFTLNAKITIEASLRTVGLSVP
jgi:hypothetical protein